jgi:hypothetical protein
VNDLFHTADGVDVRMSDAPPAETQHSLIYSKICIWHFDPKGCNEQLYEYSGDDPAALCRSIEDIDMLDHRICVGSHVVSAAEVFTFARKTEPLGKVYLVPSSKLNDYLHEHGLSPLAPPEAAASPHSTL